MNEVGVYFDVEPKADIRSDQRKFEFAEKWHELNKKGASCNIASEIHLPKQ